MGKRGRKDFRNKSGNFSKKSRQARDDVADAATAGWVDKRDGDGFSEWVYTNDNFIKYYKVRLLSLCGLPYAYRDHLHPLTVVSTARVHRRRAWCQRKNGIRS